MMHKMRLNPEPFEMILSGKKTIEYRMNDEKRQKVKIGDTITFYKRPDHEETIVVEVTDLNYYPDLYSQYEATFEQDFKGRYPNVQAVVDDTTYYKKEDIKKYGCVSIYFNKLEDYKCEEYDWGKPVGKEVW